MLTYRATIRLSTGSLAHLADRLGAHPARPPALIKGQRQRRLAEPSTNRRLTPAT